MTQPAEISPAIPANVIPRLRKWLVYQVSQDMETKPIEERKEEAVRHLLESAYQRSQAELPEPMRDQVLQESMDEIIGYGPIQPLLDDTSVTEIMVNAPNCVYVEKEGKMVKTEVVFADENAVMRLINKIILPLGRHINPDSPTVDARLPDGSRVNAVIPPVAVDSPCLTIRKFARERLTVEDIIRFGTITKNMAEFLHACVAARLNVIVSGGTGSGKTTLLNILSEFIPETERIVTIEDAAELQLNQDHIVRMESKTPNLDGTGEIPIRHLVRNALRMRPDRIIVGEVRGGEALDMLQAMNTGHDGSLTTLHANSPRDAISRLETLTLLAGFDLPLRVVREQIASAVDLIVQQSRLRDGSRKVTSITEVNGMEGENVVMTEIFKFEERETIQEGTVVGEFLATGMRPMFEHRLKAAGYKLRPEIFGADTMRIRPPKPHGRR